MSQIIKSVHTSPIKAIVVGFFFVIAVGSLLLSLPSASKNGLATGFVNSIFMATSATCVSGIVIADTFAKWSMFGQIVILFLIQIGGLGLVTFVVLFGVHANKKFSVENIKIVKEATGFGGVVDVSTIIKLIVGVSLSIELCGACLLLIRFIPDFGVGMGIYTAVFSAISAFCNAGFDVLPHSSESPVSLLGYNSDPLVLPIFSLLIILGGLGFVVWSDVFFNRKQRTWMVHTKVVLFTSVFLLVCGTIAILAFEWNNEKTLKGLPFFYKLNAAFFQAATLRSAGFFSLNPADFSKSTKLIAICLMFIGGAPGSTSGGIKVTTLAVLWRTVACFVCGQQEITISNRRIPKQLVYRAISTFVTTFLLIITAATVAYSATRGKTTNSVDIIFESVATVCTVGLSVGACEIAYVGPIIKLLFGLFMFIGRIGTVPLMLAFFRKKTEKRVVLPDAQLIVG
ncbi:MAG: hypothetical protein LBJ83_03390 [Oscillospiraceae bacterium]|jgi:trk system potassium uptake protein TrkH|nr:hypothetical protein [Oscillospiraceae bacterium]